MQNYKDYVIKSREGVEEGIFFRSPIQKVFFDAYHEDQKFSAWDYISNTNSRRFRFLQKLLGNREILKTIGVDSKCHNWTGFYANIICSPIYFKRNFRSLNAVSQNEESNIQEIISHGYESEFEHCAGACEVEKTTFVLKDGTTFTETVRKYYNYTYNFKVQELIDSGVY